MIQSMLTTVDNPYNPFDDWGLWYNWDERSGYHTTQYLARMVQGSYELSELDQHLAIETAIDDIVRENVMGVHRKVSRDIVDE